jgi:alginate O-acetyltransferase complex protein AlgI
MSFISWDFLFFLPAVGVVLFILPRALQPLFLLSSSWLFYGFWHFGHLWLLIYLTLLAFWGGQHLELAKPGAVRKVSLVIILLLGFMPLVLFKYADFFSAMVAAGGDLSAWARLSSASTTLLPAGISFFTFQAAAYIADIYRQRCKAEQSFTLFATFKAFFPQLVAGPIERPGNLLRQIREKYASLDGSKVFADYARISSGARLALWGFFKKMVIADNIAPIIAPIFAHPEQHSGAALWLATCLFAYQIYCDFSGYTDIARGSARMLGFELLVNFRRPYAATSIVDFWHRWHMSLSAWFRDYVYVPLGGRRRRTARWSFNILATFALSGLWHGANLTFIAWGIFHGVLYLAEHAAIYLRKLAMPGLSPEKSRTWRVCRVVITFQAVCAGWVFFRASSLADASLIFGKIFSAFNSLEISGLEVFDQAKLFWVLVFIVGLEFSEHTFEKQGMDFIALKFPRTARWCIYYLCIVLILIFGQLGSQQFIYFQF